MSRSQELKSIDCPSCGAGLEILGGGRVTTHICPYCGSMLDTLDHYKVLERFASLDRPKSPLKIGQSGEIGGVRWQVIGTLGMRDLSGIPVASWTEHLLYSPTHGYTWLSVEDGHLVWTRRFRGDVSPGWINPAAVELAEHPPRCSAGGENFKYYETGSPEITHAEGEFTWRPKKHDRSRVVTMLADGAMLDYVQGDTEREIEWSVYLPHDETLASFGVTDADPPRGIHPLSPFIPGPNDGFFIALGGGFAALCLVLGVFIGGTGHQILAPTTLNAADLPAELPLEIDTADRLVRLSIHGDRRQNWAWIGVDLTDPDDQPVFEAGTEISYYSGYDDGAWTEDKRTATLSFRPREIGTYTLGLDVEEVGSGEAPEKLAPKPEALTVSAVAGLGSGFYAFVLAGLFALLAAGFAAKKPIHTKRRWRGTDWTDDDDD